MTRRRIKSGSDAGFTMIATLIGTSVMAALALVAVTAVRGDIPLYSHDLASKRAYEAARAGVEDYAFRLYNDPTYWTKCLASGNPSLNQVGKTTNKRVVPGDAKAEYAVELLPATGQKECKTGTSATESMIETSGAGTGSFRIRSNGFDEDEQESVVATFKRPSFLDYVYFTQLETSDPVTYGFTNPSTQLTGAYSQCELSYEQGRYDNPIPGTKSTYCSRISFVTGDDINGPLHTNDTMAICGSPVFGREASDVIETGGSSPGWYRTPNCSADPTFKGTRINSAAILVPPETNSKLKSIAQPQFRYSGQVRICLSGGNMTVGTGSSCTGKYSGSIPSNGVIYVENSASVSCSTDYSPFTADYPSTSGCGNVYVQGTYTGSLTIAAENDVIIRDDLCRGNCGTPTGSGMLGLIANNFVRVYHPRPDQDDENDCGDSTGEERLEDLNIDAALLAIKHSFIVDHYNCGKGLGNLNVEGAIAQKFRGAVGTTGGTGYIKNYVYDNRLRYLEPPYFIEPTGTAWVVGRVTSD
jgi:Tfp pilus assembly protein PilX